MITKTNIQKVPVSVNARPFDSSSGEYFEIYNPSTGTIQALVPKCTREEVTLAIEAAHAAYHEWSATPVMKRVQVLYRFRDLLIEHADELIETLARENGKVWSEAEGDVMKAKEVVELACGTPSLMMGESLMDTSTGFDTTLYRESLGVFVGIVPFNFPAMIPMGWLMPLCIATGNTLVLKASNITPLTSLRMAELLYEAGLPSGVVNVITCDNEAAAPLTEHPLVKGVSFIGSTKVGKYIYQRAAANGKRVQALCQAKNHALVLEDAPLERTARGIINASYGCAGERCMALPAIVAQNNIADELVNLIRQYAGELKIGPGYDKSSQLGPLITRDHYHKVCSWIEKGIEEGADLVLDGRNTRVENYENGFYLGPTIFDYVQPEMRIGNEEIFGPVLSIKRAENFEEGLQLMNDNPFANGSIIFTQNGYYSREFARRSHAGMVGINVGIPVPVSIFPFTGHKNSFFGDLHVMGKDGIRFYTESKAVTSRWFDEEELNRTKIGTWDGAM